MDVNTSQCVQREVKFIYKLLVRLRDDDNQSKRLGNDNMQKLSPLYLPGTKFLPCQYACYTMMHHTFMGKSSNLAILNSQN